MKMIAEKKTKKKIGSRHKLNEQHHLAHCLIKSLKMIIFECGRWVRARMNRLLRFTNQLGHMCLGF